MPILSLDELYAGMTEEACPLDVLLDIHAWLRHELPRRLSAGFE